MTATVEFKPQESHEDPEENKKNKWGLGKKIGVGLAGLALAGSLGAGIKSMVSGGEHDKGPDTPSTSAPETPGDTWVRGTAENVELMDGEVATTGAEAYLRAHAVTTTEYPESAFSKPFAEVKPTSELGAFKELLSDNLNDALTVGTDKKTVDKYKMYLSTDGSEHGFEAFDKNVLNPITKALIFSKKATHDGNLWAWVQDQRSLNVGVAAAEGTPRTSRVEVVSVDNAGDKEAAGLSVVADLKYISGPQGGETTQNLHFEGWLDIEDGAYGIHQGQLTTTK